MVERNITILSNQKYGDVCIEHREIIHASVISNGDDAINDVWNVYNIQKVTNRKLGISLNRLIY